MIGTEGDYDPLLKRPFSLLRKTDGGLQFLYKVKGRGTTLLRNMGAGAVIDVLGPLGTPYPLPSEGRTPLLVAGGIGIASLFSLAEKLAGEAHIFYGVRTGEDFFMLEELERLSSEIYLTTDDGSCGEKGCITDILKRYLSGGGTGSKGYAVYACGPRPMMEALSTIVRGRDIRAYVAMEEHMACGIGACLGCVVKTRGGHKRVCKEGPVFPIDEIVW